MDNNELNQEKISELLLRIDGLAKSCFALEPDDLEKYKSVLRGQIHGSVSKKPDRLAALESATDEQICSMLERNVAKLRAIPETPEATQPVEAARGPELSSDIAEEPKVTLDDLVDTKKQTFIGGVKERAKVTASLIAKRVSIKSKESSLRDAHARIGVECVSSGKAQELFPNFYVELEEIALSIKAKETEGMAGANESVSDKAKGLLKSGKAKMEIESLKSKKKGILADLGSEFLAGDHLDSQMCVDDRENVRLLEQEIADLKNDTLELERSSGSLKKHMRTLAAVAILCVAIFAGVRFAAGFFSEEAKAERRARTARVEARRIAAEANTEIDRIDTDIQRTESRRETDATRIRAQQQVALK